MFFIISIEYETKTDNIFSNQRNPSGKQEIK